MSRFEHLADAEGQFLAACSAGDVDEVAEEDDEEADGAVRLAPTTSSSPLVDLARFSFFGSAARRELNALTGDRYHLTLWVKVRENWADNAQALKALGLE